METVEKERDAKLAPYLRQAHAMFRNGFEDEEMKTIFLRNTFEEICSNEHKFCFDKSLSFCLEEMIKESDMETVLKFFDSLSGDWEEIAHSPSGSHVLQTIFGKIISDIELSKKSHESDIESELLGIIKHFVALVEGNLNEMMKDPNGSHVFRSLYQTLAGVLLSDSRKSDSEPDIILAKGKVPKNFLKMLKKLTTNIIEAPRFNELIGNAHGSVCIALMVEVLHKRSLMKTQGVFCEKMFSHLKDDSMIIMMKDKHASRIFEKILKFGNKNTKIALRKVLFDDEKRFFELSAHPVANYVVQRMISSAHDSEVFKEVFDYVCRGFEDILESQNYGIMQKLCEQCLEYPDTQKQFYDKLLESFHCTDIEKRTAFVSLISTLRTHDSYFNSSTAKITSVEYHGSVLLQTLLKFDNIGLIAKSMSHTPVSDIVTLACDGSGSHFVESYLTTGKLKFKVKKEFLEKVGDGWRAIACDKYGSRVVEKMWDASDIAVKRLLIKILLKNADAMAQDQFGKFVCRKVQMKRYQTRPEEWESIQKDICQKRKMFADIIPKTDSAKRVKR